MRALAGGLACVLSMAGCFGPDAREGLRCSRDGDCPPGQDCHPVAGSQPGVCASSPPADARPAAVEGAFGAPEPVELLCAAATPCLSPRDPSLSDDRTQMAFTVQSVNAVGDHDIYLASRTDPEGRWEVAAPAGAINSLQVEEGSALSGDGLGLWFSRNNQSASGPPYGELFASSRTLVTDRFDSAAPLLGVVNTSFGHERGAAVSADRQRLLFGRALDLELPDHDLYLAAAGGGQWDTVERLDAVSLAGADERSVALVEGQKLLFASRGERILEARWSGDDLRAAEVVSMHDELVVDGVVAIVGIWASPDGREIWFGACSEECSIYRASR